MIDLRMVSLGSNWDLKYVLSVLSLGAICRAASGILDMLGDQGLGEVIGDR